MENDMRSNTHVYVAVGIQAIDAAIVVAGVSLGTSEIRVGAATQEVSVELVWVAEDLRRHDRSVTAQRLSIYSQPRVVEKAKSSVNAAAANVHRKSLSQVLSYRSSIYISFAGYVQFIYRAVSR